MKVYYTGPYLLETAHASDAGYDVYSLEDHQFYPGQRKIISCGICLQKHPNQLEHPWMFRRGFHVDVRGRSSMWKKGFNTHNGLVDEDYHKEILIGLEWVNGDNLTSEEYREFIRLDRRDPKLARKCFVLPAGSKIAQLVFLEHLRPELVRVDHEFTDTRDGWGSTGA